MRIHLAALVAAMFLASVANSEGSYLLTSTNSIQPSAVFGGTTFTLTAPTDPQAGSTASNFNVMNVGVTSVTAPPSSDSGSVTVTEFFTLTGTPGTEVFRLDGILTLVSGSTGGIVSTFDATTTVLSGSGYTLTFAGYAPPSPGSSSSGPGAGNFSILVVPNAVPEPSSFALCGIAGIAGLVIARSRRKRT